MDRTTGALPIAAAVRSMFGVTLAQRQGLKNKVNSLTRNGLVETIDCHVVEREKKHVPRDQLTTLHNAIVLQVFLPDPKRVKQVFEDPGYRQEVALTIRAMLLDRQSLVGISLISKNVEAFLHTLSSVTCLRTHRLDIPFSTLPLQIHEGPSEILNELIAQNASYESGDAMMAHFLNGDIEAAHKAASLLTTDNPVLLDYCDLIHKKYREIAEFDVLLNTLR